LRATTGAGGAAGVVSAVRVPAGSFAASRTPPFCHSRTGAGSSTASAVQVGRTAAGCGITRSSGASALVDAFSPPRRGCVKWVEKARLNPAISTAAISVAMTGGMIWRRNFEVAASIIRLPHAELDCPKLTAALRREVDESRASLGNSLEQT
jgi:hypothetical protein